MRRKRTRLCAIGVVLVLVLAGGLFWMADLESVRQRILPDGSKLTLTRLRYGDDFDFVHGNALQRVLRPIIPAKGIRVAGFKLDPPEIVPFYRLNRPFLVIELRSDDNGSNPSMVTRRSFSRAYRATIHGADGFEYTEEWRDFHKIDGKNYAYLLVSSFPRDSERLHLRVDGRDTKEGLWKAITEFEFNNPGQSEPRGWTKPITNIQVNEDLSFELGEVTVEQEPFNPIDIWTETITFPFQAKQNGILVTNWIPAYVKVEDNTGNHGLNSMFIGIENNRMIRRGWRGPDPRQIWRVQVDFETVPDLNPTNAMQVSLASVIPGPTVKNLAGLDVTLSGNSQTFQVSIPTNRTDVALKFISAKTRDGQEIASLAGSWSQHRFSKLFDALPRGSKPSEVVFAIVPTVHATFFVQPRLIVR